MIMSVLFEQDSKFEQNLCFPFLIYLECSHVVLTCIPIFFIKFDFTIYHGHEKGH